MRGLSQVRVREKVYSHFLSKKSNVCSNIVCIFYAIHNSYSLCNREIVSHCLRRKQVPVGLKMRPSYFFPEMGQMNVEIGMIRGPLESLKSVFTQSLIFPDHLDLISNVLKECVTERWTNGPTNIRANDGWMDRRKKSLESLESVFTRSSVFPDHLECISDVLEERITDGPTDQRTDRPTDGLSLLKRCEDASKNCSLTGIFSALRVRPWPWTYRKGRQGRQSDAPGVGLKVVSD